MKEDALAAVRILDAFERRVFQRVLNAKGVGPALALGLAVDAHGRPARPRDSGDRTFATLQSVPRVGRKKAEQLILDLADKLDDLQVSGGVSKRRRSSTQGGGAEDADSRAGVAAATPAPTRSAPCDRRSTKAGKEWARPN